MLKRYSFCKHLVKHRSPRIHSYSTLSISKHLKLQEEGRSKDAARPPLVLFYTWLGASSKAVERYCQLYKDRGCDVLRVEGDVSHFLLPSRGKALAKEVMSHLEKDLSSNQDRELLVHACSIGAFNYTILTMELQNSPDLFEMVSSNVKGQVFDSIVVGSFARMAYGVASMITNNAVANTIIKSTVLAYFALTKPFTLEFYNKCIEAFQDNPIDSPVLFFYSSDDPLADPEAMAKMLSRIKSQKMKIVLEKHWEKSTHAGHLRRHREEYVDTLYGFLEQCKVPSRP